MKSRFTMRAFTRVLLAALALAAPMISGCVRTLGAPPEDDYDTESAGQAMEDEEEQEAWDDANR